MRQHVLRVNLDDSLELGFRRLTLVVGPIEVRQRKVCGRRARFELDRLI